MVDKLSKYCKYVLIGLMVLNVIFGIITIIGGESSVGTFMGYAYCMLGLTVVAILFAPIYGIIINPKSVKTCVMLDKPSRSVVPFKADYVGFSIDDLFVIGYGLDYDEKYRNLPYIGYIK